MRIGRVCVVLIAGVLSTPAADDRSADRAAIRTDIDGIYQAFIHKDRAKVQATHDAHWHGFLEGSREMIRGIDEYMNYVGPMTSPYGMTGYKIRDFDILFEGDAAFVTFVTDVDLKLPGGPAHTVQRLADFYMKKNGKWMQSGSNTSISPEAISDQMDQLEQPRTLAEPAKQELLKAREAVWRAFFAHDQAALDKLIPEELITIDESGGEFGNRPVVMAASAAFAKSGARLVKLEFPKTQIQCYGNTAVVYSAYLYELENDGKRNAFSGRVTEVFVQRKGRWVNPGWHIDSGK